jgi:hypothetical protein
MREDLHSEIPHHPLAEQSRQPRLSERTDELRSEGPKKKEGCLPNDGVIVARQGDVDDTLGKDWPDELKHALEAKKEESADDE